VLARVSADPLLRSFAEIPSIDKNLEGLLLLLNACQNALFQFLELKRSLFPRHAANCTPHACCISTAFCLIACCHVRLL
jgi:hypothetical protein